MTTRSKEDIRKYQQEYRQSHKEQRKIYDQIKYFENKEFFEDKNHNYYLNNKESIIDKSNQYYTDHKSSIKEIHRVYIRNKRSSNVVFNLRSKVSKNINRMLKSQGFSKNGNSILKYLPYSIQELKEHLEKQFELWMTWNNWGKYNSQIWNDNNSSTWVWQIDHIIPQSSLPYTSMEDENFKKCWALKNLRPYSAKQNVIEGNRR